MNGGGAHYCAYIWHRMRILLTVRNALIQQTCFSFSKCAVPNCKFAQLKETPGIVQVKTEVELGMLAAGCGTWLNHETLSYVSYNKALTLYVSAQTEKMAMLLLPRYSALQ